MKTLIGKLISIYVLLATMLVQGCSSEPPKSTPDTPVVKEEPKTEVKGCCFDKAEDFIPFIPEGNKLLTIHGATEPDVRINCGPEDDPKKSRAYCNYQIDKEGTKDPTSGKYISLEIEDYCSDPDRLAEDIKRKAANSEKSAAGNDKVTFTRIEKAGVYTGYTWMDSSPGNNASNVMLEAVVGGRFKIHIQGIDHTRMDALNLLFDMIPLNQLASR